MKRSPKKVSSIQAASFGYHAVICSGAVAQERARLADPLKARMRRRLVMGLREVLRGVRANKASTTISSLVPRVVILNVYRREQGSYEKKKIARQHQRFRDRFCTVHRMSTTWRRCSSRYSFYSKQV